MQKKMYKEKYIEDGNGEKGENICKSYWNIL